MKRIASAVLLVAALACGSGDSEPPTTIPAPGSGSGTQTGGSGSPRDAVDTGGQAEQESALHPSVPRCLDLVRAGQLVEAVTPCTEALENAPDNQEVAAALERAKTAASEQASAAAKSAASEAASGASDDAASALQEKTGSLPTQMP